MKIDVILSPPEIDLLPQTDLSETTCVVFDVLRATSSMVTALAHGVTEIYPVRTIEEALNLRQLIPETVLGGERMGDKILGFDIGNSPLEYRAFKKQRIITTTTNGTIALRACEKAERVLVGALLNIDALVKVLTREAPGKVTIVCAGTFRELALEDVIAAGAVCAKLPEAVLDDSARIALATYQKSEHDLLGGLKESRNGRALTAAGRGVDVQWCAQTSIYDTVGHMQEGIITKIGASRAGF